MRRKRNEQNENQEACSDIIMAKGFHPLDSARKRESLEANFVGETILYTINHLAVVANYVLSASFLDI